MANGYNAYYTHRKVLDHVLNIVSTGDVLEFGIGEGSTPRMHEICEKQGRRLLSIEGSPKWMERYVEKYQTPTHEFSLFNVNGILTKEYPFFNEKFSVVFVDAAPANIRMPFILLMKNQVDYFVVHDTEGAAYNWDFTKRFKFVFNYTKEVPWTSVISNLDEIDPRLLSIF